MKTLSLLETADVPFAQSQFEVFDVAAWEINLPAERLTANLPSVLRQPVALKVREERYLSEALYGAALLAWDIFRRQPHTSAGPVVRGPRWAIDSWAVTLAEELGENVRATRALKPYRFCSNVPRVLKPLVLTRQREEGYRSASAYLTALVLNDLKERAPNPNAVPHQALRELTCSPADIRNAAFAQIARDFGDEVRQWPRLF